MSFIGGSTVISLLRTSLGRSRLSQPDLHHMLVTSLRYSAEDGKRAGFIDMVTSPRQLVSAAVGLGADAAKGKNRRTLLSVKQSCYHELCQTLAKPCQFHSNL